MIESEEIFNDLFSPLNIEDKLILKNRFVMAPMTRNFTRDGIPNEKLIQYYTMRAKNDVSLIIIGPIAVDDIATITSKSMFDLSTKEKVEGWKKVVDTIHHNGAKVFAQIWHVGNERDASQSPNPTIRNVVPSIADISNYASHSEIKRVIRAFANTSKIVKDIGCDGVEIHGAHGYLIDQFLWEKTNLRKDEYGGGIINRTRLASEIIQAIRNEVGENFPISFRISQWKIQDFNAKIAKSPEELYIILNELKIAGVDIFHCSTRYFWKSEFEGFEKSFSGWVKSLSERVTIAVGSIGLDNDFTNNLLNGEDSKVSSLERLFSKFKDNEFDLTAYGRLFIANPDLVQKFKERHLNLLQPFNAKMLKELN